jgi:chromatin remodeling complex protein RSC6
MPANQKNTKTQQSKKNQQSEKVAPVEEVEVAEVVEEVVEEVEEAENGSDEEVEEVEGKKKSRKSEYHSENIEETFAELSKTDQEIDNLYKHRKSVFKTYIKLINKMLKTTKKTKKMSQKKDRESTGFIRAKTVPQKFIDFYEANLKDSSKFKESFNDFNIAEDQPRTTLTKAIYCYIREHNLYEQDDEGKYNRRNIKPDNNLSELFCIKDGETIEFKTFQT